MPRLKSSLKTHEVHDTPAVSDDQTPAKPKVKLANSDATAEAHPSPALRLQEGLNAAFNTVNDAEGAAQNKIPVGWALLGLGIGCTVFWALILKVAF